MYLYPVFICPALFSLFLDVSSTVDLLSRGYKAFL